MLIRIVPARLGILVALGVLLGPSIAFGERVVGEKPRPPVSGEPAWNHAEESRRIRRAKEQAAEEYIEGLRDVEEAKGCLYRCQQLRAMAARDPESGEKAVDLSKTAQEHLRHARKKFVRATTHDPKNADAWSMLGYTLLKSGESKGAFDALERALALKPEHLGARENMAEAYLAQGKIEDARTELAWLKKKGNMATLETNNLQNAINIWIAENHEAGSKGESGKL